MPKKAHPRRYAQAVFEIALEENKLERWQTDLQRIVDALNAADFAAALASPRIRFEDKSRFLAERLGTVSPLALNLVRLLIVRHGTGMLGAIAGEYRRLVDAYHGVQKAQVVTAVPIDDRDKMKLAEELSALAGSKIIVESSVDEGILGGVIARVDGKLLDGSTRSRLAALKRKLAGAGGKG